MASIIALLTSLPSFAQKDLIILKNGREVNVSVVQVNDRHVVYRLTSKKNDPELSMDNSDVYMIHFAKRGNVYINSDGRRITGENHQLPKDADIIYLVEGKEIPAYDVKVYDSYVTYLNKKHTNKKVVPVAEVIQRNQIFLIKYTDGTIDLINDLSLTSGSNKASASAEATSVQSEQLETAENEMLVVFHNVKKGDTLASIAERYDVAVEDIITWNELSAKIKPNAKLQTDMQLMLYVRPSEIKAKE